MGRVSDAERKRPYRPKLRTGCRTCRARRIKCDEGKPSCQRCVSSNRSCEGYNDYFINWATKSYDAKESSSAETIIQPSRPILSDSGADRERAAFSFFLNRTNVQLSGFYSCDFWNKAVLQAAHHDSGIRHALNALATFHREFEEQGHATNSGSTFALGEYQLAIRSRIDDAYCRGGRGIAVGSGIACGLVFVCIEIIQGHYESAITLIKSITKLYHQSLKALRKQSAWPLRAMSRWLYYLQVQIIGLLDHAAGEGFTVSTAALPTSGMESTGFRSLTEARELFDLAYNIYVTNESLDHCDDMGEAIQLHCARMPKYDEFMSKWSEAFDAMMSDEHNKRLPDRDRQALLVLQMRRLAWTSDADFAKKQSGQNTDQMLWDAYLPAYKEIVRLGEELTSLYEDSSRAVQRRLFTLDFGMVSPLYNTARLCRDPAVRRKAIHLLSANPIREGLWDSRLAAQAAEHQMNLEEAAAPLVNKAGDVPLAARIFSLSLKFEPRQPYMSVYYSKERQEHSSMTYTERIWW